MPQAQVVAVSNDEPRMLLKNRRLILATSTLRSPGTRVGPGENFAHQVDEVVDGCLRESALVLWRATVRKGGRLLVRTGRRAPMPSDRGCRRWRPGRRR